MPFASFRLQLLKRADHTLPAGPAHGKFHDHDGQAQDDQEKQIHQHKGSAAVLAHDIRKAPYVAQADGTAG